MSHDGSTTEFQTAAQQTVILDPSETDGADAPISVALPNVHLAGSDALYDAHIEVGRHGFALFLAPTAEYPTLDIDGTREQLERLVHGLHAALKQPRVTDRVRMESSMARSRSGG